MNAGNLEGNRSFFMALSRQKSFEDILQQTLPPFSSMKRSLYHSEISYVIIATSPSYTILPIFWHDPGTCTNSWALMLKLWVLPRQKHLWFILTCVVYLEEKHLPQTTWLTESQRNLMRSLWKTEWTLEKKHQLWCYYYCKSSKWEPKLPWMVCLHDMPA